MSFCQACGTERSAECLKVLDRAEKGFPWIRTVFGLGLAAGVIWVGLSFFRTVAPVLPSFTKVSSELKDLSANHRVMLPDATPVSLPASAKDSSTPWLAHLFTVTTQHSVEDVGHIHLLFVTRPETDACRGLASQVFITRQPVEEESAALVTTVGPDMRTSFEEGLRYVRKLPRDWEHQFSIRLSFEDKFSSKDGGSAGTAFTVAMLSAIQRIELDPSVAMTGDLTIDGTVQPVGCVVEKLRGAIEWGCKVTLIPERNSRDAYDLALLDGITPLWETQILTIGTVEEALEAARKDRSGNLQKAIEKFSALRSRLPNVVTPNYLQSTVVQSELQEVLGLAPNHLTAKILLGAATNKNSPSLSLNRSVDEILSASYFFVGDMVSFQAGAAASSGRLVFPEREYEQCLQKLRKITPILDGRSLELKNCCMTYAGMLRTVWDDSNAAQSASGYRLSAQHQIDMQKLRGQNRQDLDDAYSRLRLAMRKLDVDGSLVKELRKK